MQTNCPCGANWSVGISRLITACTAGSCNLQNQDLSHGLPVGTTFAGFGTILRPSVDHIVSTTFSFNPNDYSNGFDVTDYGMLSNGGPGM